jgi:hypothetical protein
MGRNIAYGYCDRTKKYKWLTWKRLKQVLLYYHDTNDKNSEHNVKCSLFVQAVQTQERIFIVSWFLHWLWTQPIRLYASRTRQVCKCGGRVPIKTAQYEIGEISYWHAMIIGLGQILSAYITKETAFLEQQKISQLIKHYPIMEHKSS